MTLQPYYATRSTTSLTDSSNVGNLASRSSDGILNHHVAGFALSLFERAMLNRSPASLREETRGVPLAILLGEELPEVGYYAADLSLVVRALTEIGKCRPGWGWEADDSDYEEA
ncbi:hypothetical protein VTK56DRAFT_1248 [Thermocarpiscus australiensis]